MPPIEADLPETGLPETELPDAQSRLIAAAVREALARRRMSRQALADAARISISTLEKALSGRRPFTLATTLRLEEALGLAEDEPFAQSGTVSVPNQSGQIYLVTNFQGQYRLAVLGRPTIQGEMFGILTTLFSGRGTQLTPAATPLALVPERGALAEGAQYGRITAGLACEPAYRRLLDRVREDVFAVFPECEG